MQQKPLIHLFRTPGGYYFYETNRNEIVLVNREAYVLLEKMMDATDSSEIDTYMATPLLEQIKERGYLSANRPEVIKHPMTDYLQDMLDRKMHRITLQLTQDCNLRCGYCIYTSSKQGRQRSHSQQSMKWDTIRRAIDFYKEHSCDSPRVSIGFYGGEPLMAFPLLKQAIAYADEIFEGREMNYGMTTNGTLLTEEIISFCIQHNIALMVSLDGPQIVHDKNRVFASDGEGSFNTIIDNLRMVKDKFPEYLKKIRFSMVCDPSNDYDCFNSVYLDYDVVDKHNVQSSLVDTIYMEEQYIASDGFAQKNQYDLFLGLMHETGRITDRYIMPLALAFFQHVNGRAQQRFFRPSVMNREMAPGGPCVPGTIRTMVDIHGNLFPCERCSETSPVMCIGSIDHGFDIQKVKDMVNVGALTADECKNCWAIQHCSCCASRIEDGATLSTAKKLEMCPTIRMQVKNDLWSMTALHETRHMKVPAGVHIPTEITSIMKEVR